MKCTFLQVTCQMLLYGKERFSTAGGMAGNVKVHGINNTLNHIKDRK